MPAEPGAVRKARRAVARQVTPMIGETLWIAWWSCSTRSASRPEARMAAGQRQIGLRHCPFLELAETRSEIVCPVHLGLMQGAMEAWHSPVAVDRLEPFVEPDLCLAHLSSQESPEGVRVRERVARTGRGGA